MKKILLSNAVIMSLLFCAMSIALIVAFDRALDKSPTMQIKK